MGVSKKNSPCPCGSGKKYKQCCRKKNQNQKKPRNTFIEINLDEPVSCSGCRVGPAGQIELLADGKPITPASVNLSRCYDGKKKETIISQIPANPNQIQLIDNPIIALLNFDVIIAIDTNTITINGNNVSVACTNICKLEKECNYITASYFPVEAYEFWNAKISPEKLAWCILIELIINKKSYSKNLKFAIITDHDRKQHSLFNTQKISIMENFYLPKNFTLVYATSDKGSELLNILVKACDKCAKKNS